ncbi:GBF-interacting protein 1-like [Impatiens glandulifera]|uniref:GBF-interacting protein 1-like n=1 Tax=Impatiens glandulifera TaxID=253017 RepID=UPI001FB115DF|nr:GBF-interacting protein 1-like [Impatiens glandulifera]
MADSSRVPIPDNVREMVREIKNITERHSEEDVYAMLQECNMDSNEATQRLLYIDSFQEVRNRRDRKKAISGRGEDSRSSGQMATGVRGNYSNRYRGATSGRVTIIQRETSPTVPVKILQTSSPKNSPSPKKPPSPKIPPSPKKTSSSNSSNKHKKELFGGSGNESIGQDVHEGGPQKSAGCICLSYLHPINLFPLSYSWTEEVASKNSTVMIVEGTPEYVMEQTVSTPDLKLAEINVNLLHSVTFPKYIQSIDPFKGGLTFGCMDIDYEKSFASNPNTQVVPATIPQTEYVSYQGSYLIPQEGEDLVHPESPRHVHEISSLQEVDETVEYDQQIPDPHFSLPIQPILDGELQSEGHGTQSSQASYTPNHQTDADEPQSSPYYMYHPASNTYQYTGPTTYYPQQQPSTSNMYPPPFGYGYSAANTQVTFRGDVITYECTQESIEAYSDTKTLGNNKIQRN